MPKKYIKKVQKEVILFTLDTETRGLDGEIFKVGLFGDQQYFEKDSFDEINKILRKYSLTYDVHIFIHNLDFDIAKIAQDLKVEFLWKDCLIINGAAVRIKTFYFTFHDSLTLLSNNSLDKLCKDFAVENAKMDLIEAFAKNAAYRKYLVYKSPKRKSIIPTGKNKKIKINRSCKIDEQETKNYFFRNVPADDPLLLEYLKYDCISLMEILYKVWEVSGLTIDEFVKCPTTPSMAMKLFKTRFKDQYDQACTANFSTEAGKEAEEFLREAYHGGRTEVFKSKLKNGYYLDVTSLYPHVMREFRYPVGKYFLKGSTWAESIFQDNLDGIEETGGIIEATVLIPEEMQIPILPYYCDKRGKLVFPVGRIKGSWTIYELKFAVERGVQVETFHRILFFEKMSSLFIGYVNHFEKLKNDNTEHEIGTGLNIKGEPVNPSMRSFAKSMLVSLYGKFGSRRERKGYVSKKELPDLLKRMEKEKERAEKKKKPFFHESEMEFFQIVQEQGTEAAEAIFALEENYKKRMPLPYSHFGLEEEIFEYQTYSESPFIQVQICCYVTSYARIHLYKAMEWILQNGGSPYYCDTDSVFTDLKLPDEMLSQETFGKWKIEAEVIEGKFAQGKTYWIKKKNGKDEKGKMKTKEDLKFKGMPKKIAKEMTGEEMEFILQLQENQSQDYLEITTEQDNIRNRTKFMSSIKKNIDFDQLNFIMKGLYFRGEFDKRKMDHQNNTSYPWKYELDTEPEIDRDLEERIKEAEKDWEFTDYLSLMIKENEKMKIPNRNTKNYEIYKNLDAKIKKKYFSSKGTTTLEKIADLQELPEEDILFSLENHYSMTS